jgi:DNA mismatch endonuclease (patch repair protein)
MRSNKGRDTKPEVALRSAVHALGLRYRVSTRPVKEIRRTADLVFSRAKVAVFLDGCFWHGCPDHHTVAVTNGEFWAAKVEANRARDRDTDRKLADAGWVTVRVWEHEDPLVAAHRIQDMVVERSEWRRGTGYGPRPPLTAR